MILRKTLGGFAILLAFAQSSIAQSGTFTAGPMIKQTMQMSWADLEPLGSDASGVYYVLVPYAAVIQGMVLGDSDYYIGRVGNNLEMETPVPMDFAYNDEKVSYEFALELKGRYYVFTSYEDKSNKKWVLFAQQVSTNDLSLGERRKVGDIDFSDERFKRASFGYELSEDESKILVTYSLLDKDNSLVSFGYDVLDAQLNKQTEWMGNLDMSDGIYMFDQFRVSNKGDVFLITRYFADKKEYRQNTDLKKAGFLSSTRSLEFEPNYETRVVKFGSGTTTKIFPVALSDKFLTTADIEFFNQKLILQGFYSSKENTLPEGAVTMQIDATTGKVLKTSMKPLVESYALPSNTDIKSTGLSSDDQFTNYRFLLKNIIKRSTGGYTFIGERLVVQTKTQRSGNTVTTYTVYHNDDLAVVNVSASGDIMSMQKVEKSQQSTDLGYFYVSYFAREKGGKLDILFTDLGKNSVNMLGAFKDTSATLVTIATDGTQSRAEVFNSETQEVTLRASDCFETEDGSILINANKNNRYSRFMKWE